MTKNEYREGVENLENALNFLLKMGYKREANAITGILTMLNETLKHRELTDA